MLQREQGGGSERGKPLIPERKMAGEKLGGDIRGLRGLDMDLKRAELVPVTGGSPAANTQGTGVKGRQTCRHHPVNYL